LIHYRRIKPKPGTRQDLAYRLLFEKVRWEEKSLKKLGQKYEDVTLDLPNFGTIQQTLVYTAHFLAMSRKIF
jgi:hypothetical protein